MYSKKMKHLMDKLGFLNSNELYTIENMNTSNINNHYKKVIKEISPEAFFCLNKQPFILFFEGINNVQQINKLYKKIWNAQIPVVIINNENEVLFYNGTKLINDELELLLKDKTSNINSLSLFSYWSISNEIFWNKYKEKYNNNELNSSLLKNLRYITLKIEKDYNYNNSTKLILRIIFIRYLIDRKISIGYLGLNENKVNSQKKLLDIVENKYELYSLFEYMKKKMNGNLFDMSNEMDIRNASNKMFKELKDFLEGNIDLKNNQLVMFPMYDFNIIPIELISNIYEILLGNEVQKKEKAFYTPEFLVDYILEKTIINDSKDNRVYSVLDPSCGSGIFLVKAYKKILEQNDNLTDKEIVNILKNNIYGVDKNEDAVNVTIFSLYITILEYIDLDHLDNFKFPDLLNKNVIVSDFFDDNITYFLKEKEFDYIIGNPPWGNNKNSEINQYRLNNKYLQSNNEICIDFIHRANQISSIDTKISFIMPSKILYNTNNNAKLFRKFLLKDINLISVIEMSSVRNVIFESAKGPAAVIIYSKNIEEEFFLKEINHIAFKPNLFFELFKVIVQEKHDNKSVSKDLLLKHDFLWKLLNYGTIYDFDIIKNLLNDNKKINDILIENEIIDGTGMQDHFGDGNSSEHLIGKMILDSEEALKPFHIDKSKCSIFDKEKVHRPRDPNLYKAPLCLFKVGTDTKTYKMRAAFLNEDYLYKRTINSFKGNEDDQNILKNLTGLLNSSLYAYINLMIGSSIGIEREQIIKKQILQFPYKYNDGIVTIVDELSKLYSKEELFIRIESEIERNIKKLDELVLDVFGLKNNVFIDYALNIQIPELTDKKYRRDIKKADREALIKYTDIFIEYWEPKLKLIKKTYNINIYCVKNSYIMFEMVFSDIGKNEVNFINVDDIKKLRNIEKLMLYQLNDKFYISKEILNFEENSFLIIKQNNYKYWHPSRAYMDLNEIIDIILSPSIKEDLI